MRNYLRVLVITLSWACGSNQSSTQQTQTAIGSFKSELPTQQGLPADLAKQQPLWERLREPTFRRPAEAFHVYADGRTATLSETTKRWEVGPVLKEKQITDLRSAIESSSFFDVDSAVGEQETGGLCAKPHGGCYQWTVNLNGRSHWVRRPKAVPEAVQQIESSLR